MVLTTSSIVPLSKGDSSRNIISSSDGTLSDTMQRSNSIVILSTTSVPSNGFSGTMQPSTPVVHVSTSSIPLNGTQTNGNSSGITSSPNGTLSQAMQPSHSTVIATNSSVQSSHTSYSLSASSLLVNLTTSATRLSGTHSIGISSDSPISSSVAISPVTETISPSLAVLVMTTSDVPSNNILSSGAQTSPNVSQPTSTKILPSNSLGNATNSLATSNGISSASDSALSGTISPNSNYSVTSSLLSSISGEFDDGINSTKTVSPNGTYSMSVNIQPTNTTAYNLNSSRLQVNGVSNTSSAVLHTNWTAKCTNSCQNSTTKNSTELVKAYKTKFFGEVSVTVFTKTNYTISVQTTDNLTRNCSFIPGDGTVGVVVETKVSSVSFPHRYFRPGRYRARINCVHNDTVLVKFSRRIIVSLPVVHSQLSCPDLFQTDTTYYCFFTVDQASVLDIVVAIGNDSKATHSFSGKMFACTEFLLSACW